MIKELRIYYESLEQAEHYIKPLIFNAIKKINKNVPIKLVRLKGNHSYYSTKISPLIFWKDPDILVTAVTDRNELPFLLIEFSNAVFTEDHELQRFDGLAASATNDCIYVKISPLSKRSQSQHGGNVDFDYLVPFSLIYNKFRKLFYHFDWECDKKGAVIVDDNYLSCPKQFQMFDFFIEKLIGFVLGSDFKEHNLVSGFEKIITKTSAFKKWQNKVKNSQIPNIRNLNTSRTEWIDSSEEFVLKLNRFGHAMDPERGMLAYYGTVYHKTISEMLFDDQNNAWYKDTPNETKIASYIKSNGLKNGYDFLHVFSLGSGLNIYKEFAGIDSSFKANKAESLEINLSTFLKKEYGNLNKALRTIFKYSIYFKVVDKNNNLRLKITWQKEHDKEDYSSLPEITNLNEREVIEEDDVTYITVHNVLKQNNFKILAVSYPGAQSDRVILTAPGTGRKQERRYIDVISYLPGKFTALQENKGKYTVAGMRADLNELSLYKTSKDHINGLSAFLSHFDKRAPKTIKIGVGFWANSGFTTNEIKELDIRYLDYFVYITSDRKEWIIWKTGNKELFKKLRGIIEIPLTFEPATKESENKNQKQLE